MDRIRMNEMLAKLSLSDPIPIDQFGGKGKQNTTRGEKARRGIRDPHGRWKLDRAEDRANSWPSEQRVRSGLNHE